MKNIAQVSYNIHANFTNYGSALQSWALSQVIKGLGHNPILVDYCPDCLRNVNPLYPLDNMWDVDEESRLMCELSLPAIKVNYDKFVNFYNKRFKRSKPYIRENFSEIINDEQIDGFVCGSDTIFCVDEFGIDDGYFANYPCMKYNSISYAASFGDAHFCDEDLQVLEQRLHNFKAISIREQQMIDYIKTKVSVPVSRVLDPTLLLTSEQYSPIIAEKQETEGYVLLYARRYNKAMFDYADKVAKEKGLKVIDISLRATNVDHHRMFYEAGVEEFLSLTKHADFIVTNSFHSVIMAVLFERPFVVFSREQCDQKIDELLIFLDLKSRKMINGDEIIPDNIDYATVNNSIKSAREESILFLKNAIELL